MGTRSLTYVYDGKRESGDPVVCMYRQMDGYPSGHGSELATYLSAFTIVNGICGSETPRTANGMSCLAAQLVAHFKTGIGNFYLLPTVQDQDSGQEYEYHIYEGAEEFTLEIDVFSNGYKTPKKLLFSGPVGELQTYIDTPQEEET